MAESGAARSTIGDYAVIGNCHTAALISRLGGIDWWCPHRFDGPSVFGALLDPEVGGRWWLGPEGEARSERRYLPDTNVLETTYTTASGVVRVVDFMPMRAGRDGMNDGLEPRIGIVRRVEGVEGHVPVATWFVPRWGYGRVPARIRDRGEQGMYAEYRGEALLLRSSLPLVVGEGVVRGRGVVRAGDRRVLALAYADREPLVLPPIGSVADLLLQETVDWWRAWISRCTYHGPYATAVRRSALVLKLLCHAPSGAVVAAPTTSLPERVGGVRNWDYRYCWLRDASMTLRALVDLGFSQESTQFLNWMLTATQLTAPRLNVMYDVYGNPCPRERTLDWLRGYRDSRPVRVGNGASGQLQLDLYGEVCAAALAHARRGGKLGTWQARLLVGLGRTVCGHWRRPDSGIWEPRGPRRHYTHSKVNGWRALTALIALAEAGCLGRGVPLEDFRAEADAIRDAVYRSGFDVATGSFVSWFHGGQVDASLLLLGIQGFLAADDPRMVGTWRRLERELGRDGLWLRYTETWPDGLPGGEGAFGIASFWAVEFLVRAGRRREARAAFERLLRVANDVGLYAEEIDPASGAPLGNFPQGFTHVGLVSAALALAGVAPGQVEEA